MEWVWASSRSWWWTGKPGVLQSMGWQRVRYDWATELNSAVKGKHFYSDFIVSSLFRNMVNWMDPVILVNHLTISIMLLWFSHSVLSDSCNPMGCSPPGSSVHGISQARILEQVAISFPRGSSQPGIKPASLASPALAGATNHLSHQWEFLLNKD